MSKPHLKHLDEFYQAHSKAIKKHCKVLGVKMEDIELKRDNQHEHKVIYTLNGKTIMIAEMELRPVLKVRRYGINS